MAEMHVDEVKKGLVDQWDSLIKEIQAIQERVDDESSVHSCLQAAVDCAFDRQWFLWLKDHPEN
jgi:hypothetical protein